VYYLDKLMRGDGNLPPPLHQRFCKEMIYMRARRGFTLVEVMIVVALIGMLASLAIPNFIEARAAASMSACISSLTQLSSAKEMFNIDNGAWPNNFTPDLDPYMMTVPATCPLDGAAYNLNAGTATTPTCPNAAAGHVAQ
jgi:prepilin-type N-terminal cleavage/methylation domain-containing protein